MPFRIRNSSQAFRIALLLVGVLTPASAQTSQRHELLFDDWRATSGPGMNLGFIDPMRWDSQGPNMASPNLLILKGDVTSRESFHDFRLETSVNLDELSCPLGTPCTEESLRIELLPLGAGAGTRIEIARSSPPAPGAPSPNSFSLFVHAPGRPLQELVTVYGTVLSRIQFQLRCVDGLMTLVAGGGFIYETGIPVPLPARVRFSNPVVPPPPYLGSPHRIGPVRIVRASNDADLSMSIESGATFSVTATGRPNAPFVFIALDTQLGAVSLAPFGSTQVALSPNLIMLSDPFAALTPSVSPTTSLDWKGELTVSFPEPLLGFLYGFGSTVLYAESFVIDPMAPNGGFYQSPLRTLTINP